MFNTLEMRCVDKGFGVFKLQKALCNAFSSQKEHEKSARGAVVQVHPFSYMPDLSFSFCREKVVQIVIGNFSCKRVTSFVLSNFPKLVKLEIGLARGKKLYDKREYTAKRDANREMDRAIKERNA